MTPDRRFSVSEFVWVSTETGTHYGRIIGCEDGRHLKMVRSEWIYTVRIYGTGGQIIAERQVTGRALRRPTETTISA